MKNVTILMSGTAVSQGITIAAAPVLSRLFDPEAFGTLAIYTSIISILAVIVTWRYELAIVLPKDDEEARHVFQLSTIVVVLMSFLTLILIMIFGNKISDLFNMSELLSVLWWVPVSILFMGIYQNLSYWNTRRKKFKRVANSQITRSSVVVSTQIISGNFKGAYIGLIGGQVLGQIASTLVLGFQVFKEDKLLKQPMNFSKIRKSIKEYIDFPKYSAPQGLMNSLSQNLPIFLLSYFYGPQVLGYYALSLKFIQLPLSFITQSFRQVYFQKITDIINNKKNYFLFLIRTTLILFSIVIIPSLIIFLYGAEIYRFVLGDIWFEAGKYAEWTILWLVLGFLNTPAFVTAQSLRLQKQLLYYEISLVICRVVGLIIGGIYFNAIESIILYSIIGAFFNFTLIIVIIFYAYRKSQDSILIDE